LGRSLLDVAPVSKLSCDVPPKFGNLLFDKRLLLGPDGILDLILCHGRNLGVLTNGARNHFLIRPAVDDALNLFPCGLTVQPLPGTMLRVARLFLDYAKYDAASTAKLADAIDDYKGASAATDAQIAARELPDAELRAVIEKKRSPRKPAKVVVERSGPRTIRHGKRLLCVDCDKPVHPADQYCIHCGFQLVDHVPRCPFCHAYVAGGDKFCIMCGNRLSGVYAGTSRVES